MPSDRESRDLPDFTSEDELADWFEHADLSQYRLETVDVAAGSNVTLTLAEPWVDDEHGSTGTAGKISLLVQ
jgi:hypothetical protein